MSTEGQVAENEIAQIWKLIAHSKVFANLDRASRVELVEYALKLEYVDQEVIITEGERSDGFYLLLKGSAEVFTDAMGEHQKFADLAEGSFFGEMGILQGSPRTASVRAMGESECIRFPRRILEQVLDKSPETRQILLDAMMERSDQNLETEIAALTAEFDDDPGT